MKSIIIKVMKQCGFSSYLTRLDSSYEVRISYCRNPTT